MVAELAQILKVQHPDYITIQLLEKTIQIENLEYFTFQDLEKTSRILSINSNHDTGNNQYS